MCEDVTEKDLCQAVAEGFSDMETLKRYSTAGMGPCQGKMCACSVMEVLSRETSRSLAETGATTARPPYVPVSFRALAGPSFQPVKRTPMHHSHENLGAKMIDLGGWERPELYSSVKDEHRAVRERAGLIDVSTLGKIDLRGKDVVKLLEKVYTNKWSDLQVGRIRYGLMCDEGGIVFDDGTCGRLAGDHYFLTTTTGNAETVYQWLDWWLVGTGWDVCVTNVTSCYAAINLAGPDARRILSRLTESDVSNDALPYMGLAEVMVTGVPCRLLRIGFVGEVGYEIHFPSEYGEHVWKAVMAAGADFGARPFGVETQRVLRLEKKHIIVGQDTDANSNPLEAGMSWAVKLDKPDFVGRRALAAAKGRGPRQSLVGFRTVGSKAVPPEGCQIVKEGRSVGRITSARLSPSTGAGIALGWVPVDQSGEGTEVSVRVEGRDRKLQVTHRPFYDPEGERLRS
ncbi:MAG: (2Fe-2S)-binding protein [Armatimonadetes bacterium]|nr:(2Fe-2S)-binding protein [Armatimonadota bacterium]